jgi:hypothetical protein
MCFNCKHNLCIYAIFKQIMITWYQAPPHSKCFLFVIFLPSLTSRSSCVSLIRYWSEVTIYILIPWKNCQIGTCVILHVSKCKCVCPDRCSLRYWNFQHKMCLFQKLNLHILNIIYFSMIYLSCVEIFHN